MALTRTSSNRSDVSMYSGYTSVTSFSSVASTSSTSSSRRMIIPLYNLQAHNVMTNVIVDAGTDAKVAKFQRRGLEVIGLAVLEPVEVWPGASLNSDFSRGTDGALLSTEASQTATSSAVSLTSDTHQTNSTHDSIPVPTTPIPQQPQQQPPPLSDRDNAGGARKFFGKMFRKKAAETSSTSSPRVIAPPPPLPLHLQQEQTPRANKRSSLLLAASQLTQHLPSPSSSSFHPQSQVIYSQAPSGNIDTPPPSAALTQQVLGIQSSLSSPVYPPRGRHPRAYVWVVRRWLKNGGASGDGFLGGMIGDRSNASSSGHPVEVRFEWTRQKPKGSSGKERRNGDDDGKASRRTSKALSSKTPSIASFAQQQTSPATLSPEPHSPRLKTKRLEPVDRDSRRSSSPKPGSIRTHTTQSEGSPRRGPSLEEGDDGDESDPEDSETPWTCSIVLRPQPSVTSPSLAHSPTQQQPQEVRLKVGQLVPAPHHPKVVAVLKIPFPLPDIEVDKAILRKRVITPAGVARPATAPSSMGSPGSPPTSSISPFSNPFGRNSNQQQLKPTLVLTAEEIKDIVSCTSLWLIVREGFGGVGKERRKGDGWRIRG